MKPTQVIDSIVKQHVAPMLRAQHFRKKGSAFWRDGGEVIDVVTVQKSEWNDSESASFAINLGLYWKVVQGSLGQTLGTHFPREHDCTVRQRLGPLFFDGRDFWWKVMPDSDASRIGRDVVEKLVAYGLPWLERGHDIEQTLQYAERMNFIRQRDAVLALRRDGWI